MTHIKIGKVCVPLGTSSFSDNNDSVVVVSPSAIARFSQSNLPSEHAALVAWIADGMPVPWVADAGPREAFDVIAWHEAQTKPEPVQ